MTRQMGLSFTFSRRGYARCVWPAIVAFLPSSAPAIYTQCVLPGRQCLNKKRPISAISNFRPFFSKYQRASLHNREKYYWYPCWIMFFLYHYRF